jgi:GTP-binding protein
MQIRLFCNRVERLDPAYRRYLERAIIHEFRLDGCPIRFDLVGKEQRYSEGETSLDYVPRQSDAQQHKARVRKMGEKAAEINRKHPEKRPKIFQEKAKHNQ